MEELETRAFYLCESLKALHFTGPAPVISDDCFELCELDAYYPRGDASYSEEVRKDYSGEITWIPCATKPVGPAI